MTLPLLRPGLANAFLLGFVESMADFGNPLVLGGNFEVLSTKIFFAVVGAAHDQSRAAVLALVLLALHAGGVLGRSSAGSAARPTPPSPARATPALPVPLPRRPALAVLRASRCRGRRFTLGDLRAHLRRRLRQVDRPRLHADAAATSSPASRVDIGQLRAWYFSGAAWNSFCDHAHNRRARGAAHRGDRPARPPSCCRARTSPASAPSSSARCCASPSPARWSASATSWPSTCRRSSSPAPASILVICFVFRNMPVGVRAGIAALARSTSASTRPRRRSARARFATMRRVMLPLLRPAIVAALVYSFVRAMTAVSAVIFLVTRRIQHGDGLHRRARRGGEFGLAIAYSSVLIVVMLVAIAADPARRRRAATRPPRLRRRRCRMAGASLTMASHARLRRVPQRDKRYGAVAAVDDVSFIIEPGTLVTLLGPVGLRQDHHAAADRRASRWRARGRS